MRHRFAANVSDSTCDRQRRNDNQLLHPPTPHAFTMRYRHILLLLAFSLSANAACAIEPSELKPGLIATYRDGPNGREVIRLEPTVAITLAKGESPHPALATGSTMRWKGHINFSRAGKYTFHAIVEGGTLTVNVNGKDALGAEVQAAGGVMTFEATFTRNPANGPARVELSWDGPGFILEPLNHQYLGHLVADRPPSFTSYGTLEHGRFLFEELACAKCHKPDANDRMARTLAEHTGPNLTEVARRTYAGWIYAWLANPAKLRPHTTMPKLFADDDTADAERYAITQYLVSLAGGKPLKVYRYPTVPRNDLKQSMERGRVLYYVTGCAACHDVPAKKKPNEEDDREPLGAGEYVHGQSTIAGPAAKYPLGQLGSKTRPEALAATLQDPLKNNSHGRMPSMNLNPQEATDLARYLCRTREENVNPEKVPEPKLNPADVAPAYFRDAADVEKDRFDKLKPDAQWVALGARIAVAKGCVNCHTVERDGKSVAPRLFGDRAGWVSITQAHENGCLDPKPNAAKSPVYSLDPKERAALVKFLKEGLKGAGSPAQAYQARVALRRFNCLNCHQRDGEGGIAVELADQMRQLEKAQNADEVRPPVLTGIGHKTRTSWLRQILTQSGRARPWMQLRMPQYGEPNVGFLPQSLAALEGTVPDDTVHTVARTGPKVAAGRTIVGKSGLGCISCHDIGGVANTGTRGPDLATTNQRVRYEWFERWLSQPLRMAPGTRMPQAFIEGTSTLKTILAGNSHQQAEAMWAYLSLGPGLPLPEGLEPPKGLVIAVKDRAEVLRTFMPDAGTKAIAVGYPGEVSLAFSADQCRTAYAWAGNFLDASPVWNNRGGAPAKLLGQRFWTAPAGHPWGLTTNAKVPPDFIGRARNPAFGTPLPLEPARVYEGPMAVQFDGYSRDKDGRPTFRYRLDETGKGAVVDVAETPRPLKGSLANGLARKFEATTPGGYQAWFFAGVTGKEPRAYDAKGRPVKLDLKASETSVSADVRLVMPTDGDRAMFLEVNGLPHGSVWTFVPGKSGGWLAILKFPSSKAEQKINFTLNTWALPKDDEGLLKEMFAR